MFYNIWQRGQKNSSLLNKWNHGIFFFVVDSKRVNFKINIPSLFLPSLARSTHTQCDASTYSSRCAIIIQSFRTPLFLPELLVLLSRRASSIFVPSSVFPSHWHYSLRFLRSYLIFYSCATESVIDLESKVVSPAVLAIRRDQLIHEIRMLNAKWYSWASSKRRRYLIDHVFRSETSQPVPLLRWNLSS